MIKSIIVAKTKNHVIGKNNQLHWHMPQDMQHFQRTTTGHHVMMGRKTFESIGKLLPGRELIIVTRNPHYRVKGCTIVHDTTTALILAEQAGATEIFIAGGGEIYKDTLAVADKIYLTEIKTQLEGDTFFPIISVDQWEEVKRIRHAADAQHRYAYDFVELVRKIHRNHNH